MALRDKKVQISNGTRFIKLFFSGHKWTDSGDILNLGENLRIYWNPDCIRISDKSSLVAPAISLDLPMRISHD